MLARATLQDFRRRRRSPREGRRRPPPWQAATRIKMSAKSRKAEHRQPDTEVKSGGGDEPDGVETDSASSWDTVEGDGGAEQEGRWKAAVVIGKPADPVDGGPGEPDAADRPIVVRPEAAAAGAGRPTRPRDDGGGGAAAAAARAAAVRAAAVERLGGVLNEGGAWQMMPATSLSTFEYTTIEAKFILKPK